MDQWKDEDIVSNGQLMLAGYGLQEENDENSISRRLKVSKFRYVYLEGHHLNEQIDFASNYTTPCIGRY